MDEQRFDDLTRTLVTGSASRRRVLRGLLATGGAGVASLVGLSGRFGVETAEARYNGTCRDQTVRPEDFVSKNGCGNLPCGPEGSGCVCAQTLGHVRYCVQGFDPTSKKDCPKKDECGDRRPCANGFVCAKTQNCCGTSYRKCLRKCRRT